MKLQNMEEGISEFLMMYGWVILIILTVIGTFAYFGVINPSIILPEKCAITGTSGLFCDNFNADSNQIILKLKNSLREIITITPDSEISDGENSCKPAEPKNILSVDSGEIIFDQDGSTGSCSELTSKSKIKAGISLKFEDSDGFLQTAKGDLLVKT